MKMFILFVLLLMFQFIGTSEGGDLLWTRIHPQVDVSGFTAIASSEQGLMAIGRGNAIDIGIAPGLYFSKDGRDWLRGNSPERVWWRGIAGSGAGFVAVGDGGVIAFSKHGYAWQAVVSGVTIHLQSVVWTGSAFIACGAEGNILRSVDGKTWQTQLSGVATSFRNVFLADGNVVAVGGTVLASSLDDGLSWTTQDLGAEANLMRGCARNGGVLLYSENGSVRKFYRENGLGEWETLTVPGGRPLTGLGFHAEKGYLAVNDYGALLLSADGVTWSTAAEALSGAVSIANINEGWMIAGSEGEIMRLGRGRGWNVPASLQASAHSVALHAGRYYAFGHYGWIHTSIDGVSWTAALGNSSADVLRSSVSFNNQLIVVGDRGAVRRIDAAGAVSFGYVGSLADLQAVTSSGTRLIAVGKVGVIYRSDDGITWTAVTSPVTEDLHAINYSAGRFHAVGKNGTLIESTDGVTWTEETLDTTATLLGITATGDGLIVVGRSGGIFRKTALGSWQGEESGTEFDLHAVIDSDAGAIACGNAGTLLFRGSDGAWICERTSSPAGCDFRAAVMINGRLMLVGASGIYEDSINTSSSKGWVVTESTGGGIEVLSRSRSGFEAVVAVPDGFLAAGWNGRTMLSPDGEQWSEGSFPENWTIRDLAVADGLILAGGDQGIMVSTEGRFWKPVTYEKYQLAAASLVSPNKQVRRLVRGFSDWLAVGYSGTALRSVDGMSWHRPADPTKALGSNTFTGAAYGAGKWVISGESGKMRVSSDAETWAVIQTPTNRTILDVCYFGGRFLASIWDAPDTMLESYDGTTWVLTPGISGYRAALLRAANGRCFGLGPREKITSTADGSTWKSHSEGTKYNTDSDANRPEIRGIAFKNGVHAAVGTRGMIAHSLDGDNWTYARGGDVRGFQRVSWLRNRFVALAQPGNLLSSTDARTWTNHRTGNYPHESLVALADSGTRAVAVGKTVLVSDDLVSWSETGVPTGKEFTSVAWDGTRFMAGSKDGGIYHSSDGVNWNLEYSEPTQINDVAGIAGLGLALSGANIKTWTHDGPWSPVPNSWGNGDYRFLYADGTRFMATGSSTFALWSADGQNWERLFIPSTTLGRVAKGAQGYYALSPDSTNSLIYRLLGSEGGREWSAFPIALPERGVNVIEQSDALLTFHERGEIMLGVPLLSRSFQTELLASGHPFTADLSPSADANGDGISNIFARYFGLNIVNPNSVGIATLRYPEMAEIDQDFISVSIPTPEVTAQYLSAAIEMSGNLHQWEDVAVRLGAGSWVASPGGTISVDIDGSDILTLPTDTSPQFFRLKIWEEP